jgi:hypothetical protein
MVEYYALMYENGEMRPVETIPGVGGGRIKENGGGVNSTLIHCKNFGKCHNVPNNNIINSFLNKDSTKKVSVKCYHMLNSSPPVPGV